MPRLDFLTVFSAATTLWLASAATAQQPVISAATAADQRVAAIGERLATAASPLCASTVARTGLDLHSRAQYGRLTPGQEQAMFPVANGIAILLTVPGSAADRAGIAPGSGLVAIDDLALPLTPPAARASYQATRAALDSLDTAMRDGHAELRLRLADGSERTVVLLGQPGCATRFQMEPGGDLSAEADGVYVKIGEAMVDAASEDDVLAASLAHELAHNILRHRQRQNAAGMRRGLARMFGRNAALSRTAESEADQLVPWLLAMDGRDPAAALRWLDLLEDHVGPSAPTHPSWARRRQIMVTQLALIAAQRNEGQTVRPPFDTIALANSPLQPDAD